MKKELKEGMGFICETLEDKKRIWQKLTDAGYPMACGWEDSKGKEIMGIKWFRTYFGSIESEYITHPLNESDFFDEWTPKAGEWVEVSDDGKNWYKRQFFCIIDKLHLTASGEYTHDQTSTFTEWQHIRQIKPETMTLQEVREALGKPNLIVTQ